MRIEKKRRKRAQERRKKLKTDYNENILFSFQLIVMVKYHTSLLMTNHSMSWNIGEFNRTYIFDDNQSNRFINQILFFLTLFISIPSIFINLYAIYRLHTNKKLTVFVFRSILHLSLFTTLTCVPFFLLELYNNLYFPLPIFICKLWLIIDYSSIVSLGLLVFWASIQRHILIFGPIHIKKLQSTLKFKLIPTILTFILPLTWYSILASACHYDTTPGQLYQCRPCFEHEKTIFLVDTILSLIVPLFITLIVTFCLLIRILRLRLRIFRLPSKKWRRCKRLTRQMILFSLIYLIGLVPYVLTNLNSLYNFWPWMNSALSIQIADTLSYVPCCFSPFLSIYAFPEICQKQKNHHHHHHRHHHHHHRHHHHQQQLKGNQYLDAVSCSLSKRSSITM